MGSAYFPPCCAGLGGYPPGCGPLGPPRGYGGGHAHTAPPSPLHRRRPPAPDAPPRRESLEELRSTVHTAASSMERSSDDVRLLGQKMAAATAMMSESVQENAQALGLLAEVVDKLRGLVAAGRGPAPYAAPAPPPAASSSRHAHFLSSTSSSSSSSGSFCVYADGPALPLPRPALASPKTGVRPTGAPPRHAQALPPLSNGILGARPVANHSKTGCLFVKKEKKKKK